MYELIGPDHHTVTFTRHWLMLIIILAVWEAIWRLIAFWRAGRNNHLGWFVAMAILNTAGLLEIVYLLFFQKKAHKKHADT